MSLEIRQQAATAEALGEYARISIAFLVDRILEVTPVDGGLGGMSLAETPIAAVPGRRGLGCCPWLRLA